MQQPRKQPQSRVTLYCFFSHTFGLIKYDILIIQRCVWRSRVVNPFASQPSLPGAIRARVLNAWNERTQSIDALCKSTKGVERRLLFLL